MNSIRIRRGVLASSLALALFAPYAVAQTSTTSANDQQQNTSSSNSQQGSTPTSGAPNAKELKAVVVTGSMIPRTEIEGATPVVSLTGQQIKDQGYTTLWEFLDSLPQVGQQTSDPASWGSSSVNARSVNLRGVGPGFSLLMIDGHRVVDYPQPLNKQSNFQNYNNIPTGMIDHVEILASGASSIYGSDAVAGVINVILKKNYQGDDVQVTGGGATRGGREYGDINFFGGHSGENWHVLYNVEKSNRTALWGMDRPYQDSVSDAGYGSWSPASRMFGYQYDSASAVALSAQDANNHYITPPAGTCGKFTNSQLSHSYSVTTSGTQVTGSTDNGYYCSQPALFQNWVLTPGSRSTNFFVAGEYDFKNGLQAYGSVALYDTVGISNTQLPAYGTGKFYDQTTGQVINQAIRQLTAQEMGTAANTHDREQNWNLQAGLRGTLFDSRFNWDLNLNSQKYTVREDFTGINIAGMNDFFLGKQQGTTAAGDPIYAMNWQQWWNPITPQQYSQFAVNGTNTSSSWLDQAQFRINGDLFKFPWVDESVGWAAVLEAAHNGFLLSPDPRATDPNTFQNPFGAYLTGGGTRQRYSFGTEFRVPVVNTLTWTISGRIDKYNDASSADIARTWGTGLEWRPYDGLLLRGSYGTNFKAPDMQAIYLTGSSSPVGDYIDPLQCINAIKAGQTNSTWCNLTQRPVSQYYTLNTNGSRLLQPQTGHSWTYGFVWQIPGVQGLSVSADYWHLGVDNAIEYLGADTVLADEAGCLTGYQVNGTSALSPYTAHVPGSAYCSMVTQMVQRNASGQIVTEESGPINEASLYVSGIDASLDYKLHTDDYGDFRANINYTDNLEYKQRVLASDQLQNTRYNNVASRIAWIADWHKGPWDVSISGIRDGGMRAPNYGSCNTLPNGIQPSMVTVQNGTETVSTGVCQVMVNGSPVTVQDSTYQGHTPVWITWNTAVGYQITDKAKLKLTVNNIFDRVSPIPYYAGGFEFVTTGQTGSEYNGREMFLTFDYKID